MVQGGAGKELQAKGMEKCQSRVLKPTPTLLKGCHPRDSVSSPSRRHRESSPVAHFREATGEQKSLSVPRKPA